MLVSVESTDRFDNSTLAMDCSGDELRSFEAPLYQVLHRKTANGPLRTVQQAKGQKGFEEGRAIVRRCDQRNMSDTNFARAALISNISERDRAKDVEQFDDILRAFINETNKLDTVCLALLLRSPRSCSLLLPLRAGGWHIVHEASRSATWSSIFLVASSQSHLVVLFH